jgi:hypothetical protein
MERSYVSVTNITSMRKKESGNNRVNEAYSIERQHSLNPLTMTVVK